MAQKKAQKEAEQKADGPVTAALFDVDGTLADTNYLHAVTWWEAFGQAGHAGDYEPLTLDEMAERYGREAAAV